MFPSLANAFAYESQPEYPQAPQFAPGSTSRIATSFSFTGTANTVDATERRTAAISPTPPTSKTAINTTFNISHSLLTIMQTVFQ